MAYNEIIATVDVLAMKKVRRELRKIHVPGMTVSAVKGYGEHKNAFRRDLLQRHSVVRVIATDDQTDNIVQTIMDAAHSGMEGDGIITVTPVAQFYNIRDKKLIDG